MSFFGSDKPKRKQLSAHDKMTIIARQDYKCALCEIKFSTRIRPHYDHRRPLSEGGTNDLDNMRAICANCHDHKTRKENKKRNSENHKEKDPFGIYRNPLSDAYGITGSKKNRKKKDGISFW
ncbi:MAG: hypothetical protein DA330_04305 [Nitrososphaera sp.]|nr:hypothetical protein [Nitrososphaera sp.]